MPGSPANEAGLLLNINKLMKRKQTRYYSQYHICQLHYTPTAVISVWVKYKRLFACALHCALCEPLPEFNLDSPLEFTSLF